MRILHTSDLHLGRQLFEFSLLEDQAYFLDWLVDLIDQKAVDAVLLAGDIYNRPQPPADAIDLYNSFLSRVVTQRGVPVFAIAGNHDGASWLEFGSSLYGEAGYHVAGHVKKEITAIPLGENITIWLMPYLHPADLRSLTGESGIRTFDQAYQALLKENLPRLSPNSFHILMGHGFFSNLSATGKEKEMITSESENNIGGIDIADVAYFDAFDYVALGHLHAPQWVKAGKARYSGSPLKYSLSEETQRKSVTLLEVVKGECSVEEVPVPPLRDVRTISGEWDTLLLPESYGQGSFSDYVFAEIKGTERPFAMEKLRVLFPHLLGLRFTDSLVQSMPDLEKHLEREARSADQVFADFYEKMKQEPMTKAQQALLQDIVTEMGEER